ncbi:MAG TPA: dienelactone hydrolase family protein [Acidimicrobiia bacterium]|nr:dienelactone hydrolase family protein [Acidimicrobiia bacterium]
MGQMIEFPSNGTNGTGYLAEPDAGGPGVIVIQEWWGLVPHVKDVCDRFADAGFVALAPDLYHGEATTEPDQAGKLMMALNVERAAKELSGAVDEVQRRGSGSGVGVVGYCMGGGLALYLATLRPDAVTAAAPYYGVIPWQAAQPEYANLAAAVQGHYAASDDFLPVDQVKALEEQLRDLGKDAEFFIYDGTGHGFFNDSRPEAYVDTAAKLAWDRTLTLFNDRLR